MPADATCPHAPEFDHDGAPLRELAETSPGCFFRELDRRMLQVDVWLDAEATEWAGMLARVRAREAERPPAP